MRRPQQGCLGTTKAEEIRIAGCNQAFSDGRYQTCCRITAQPCRKDNEMDAMDYLQG